MLEHVYGRKKISAFSRKLIETTELHEKKRPTNWHCVSINWSLGQKVADEKMHMTPLGRITGKSKMAHRHSTQNQVFMLTFYNKLPL